MYLNYSCTVCLCVARDSLFFFPETVFEASWLEFSLFRHTPGKPHSHHRRLGSFWSAPRIVTSGLVQHQKSVIHRLSVKSDNSDWLRIRNENSTHAEKIRSCQRLQVLVLTKRSMSSGYKNEQATAWMLLTCSLISELLLQIKTIIQVLLMEKLKRSRYVYLYFN